MLVTLLKNGDVAPRRAQTQGSAGSLTAGSALAHRAELSSAAAVLNSCCNAWRRILLRDRLQRGRDYHTSRPEQCRHWQAGGGRLAEHFKCLFQTEGAVRRPARREASFWTWRHLGTRQQ